MSEREMSEQGGAQYTLGKIHNEQHRDAIHVAVAPVIAATLLSPGEHIGIVDGERAGRSSSPLGIVDPFLRDAVKPGERFWMFLYPNTITALRHQWTHPNFADAPVATPLSNEKDSRKEKAASEAWLRNFVKRSDCPSYEAVIAAAIGEGARQWDDEYLHFDGQDAHGEIPPEFWNHVEIVTDRKLNKRPTHFSCSC